MIVVIPIGNAAMYKLSAGCSVTVFHVFGCKVYLATVKRQKSMNRDKLMLHDMSAIILIGSVPDPTMKWTKRIGMIPLAMFTVNHPNPKDFVRDLKLER